MKAKYWEWGRGAMLLIFLMLQSGGALAETQKQPEREKLSEATNIMCLYMMIATHYGVGRACFGARDKKMLDATEAVMKRFDAFILKNNPKATPETLKKFKERHTSVWKRRGWDEKRGICVEQSGNIVERYNSPRSRKRSSPERLKKWTDELLSVDRFPGWNPCL